MKVVWVVIGVLAFLGLACCGGIFFLGRGAVNAVSDMTKGADEYSARVFPEIAKEWDLSLVRQESSPEFKTQVSDETLNGLFKLYRTKLGKFKSVGKFTSDNFQVKTNNGDTVSLVNTKARAEFEKDSADVELECIKRGDSWKLLGITLRSDTLIK